MKMRRVAPLFFVVFATGFALVARGVEPPPALHGMADAFAAPGVALAWAIARGPDESATRVAIRIAADPAVFSHVAIIGSDPFTQRSQVVLPPTPTAGVVDLQVPRAHFAEFPRSEIRLYGAAGGSPTGVPSLVVFYVGVPDTTPEFLSEASLAASLAERLARARGKPGGATP